MRAFSVIGLIFLMFPLVLGASTFFDNPDDSFIMDEYVAPTPVTPPTRGGGGRITLECVNDSDCELGEFCFENKCYVYECDSDADCNDTKTCWMNRCVKLFDMKIIEVQSPIYPGEFFNFTYYLKGVAAIHGDVIVRFWLVKDGEVVTEGFDTIYIGDFDEKTEKTELFLPITILPGTYNFYAEVEYDSYYARAGRLIEVGMIEEEPEEEPEIRRGFFTGEVIAEIRDTMASNIISILIISILIIVIIICWRKKKKEKIKERLELPVKELSKSEVLKKKLELSLDEESALRKEGVKKSFLAFFENIRNKVQELKMKMSKRNEATIEKRRLERKILVEKKIISKKGVSAKELFNLKKEKLKKYFSVLLKKRKRKKSAELKKLAKSKEGKQEEALLKKEKRKIAKEKTKRKTSEYFRNIKIKFEKRKRELKLKKKENEKRNERKKLVRQKKKKSESLRLTKSKEGKQEEALLKKEKRKLVREKTKRKISEYFRNIKIKFEKRKRELRLKKRENEKRNEREKLVRQKMKKSESLRLTKSKEGKQEEALLKKEKRKLVREKTKRKISEYFRNIKIKFEKKKQDLKLKKEVDKKEKLIELKRKEKINLLKKEKRKLAREKIRKHISEYFNNVQYKFDKARLEKTRKDKEDLLVSTEIKKEKYKEKTLEVKREKLAKEKFFRHLLEYFRNIREAKHGARLEKIKRKKEDLLILTEIKKEKYKKKISEIGQIREPQKVGKRYERNFFEKVAEEKPIVKSYSEEEFASDSGEQKKTLSNFFEKAPTKPNKSEFVQESEFDYSKKPKKDFFLFIKKIKERMLKRKKMLEGFKELDDQYDNNLT